MGSIKKIKNVISGGVANARGAKYEENVMLGLIFESTSRDIFVTSQLLGDIAIYDTELMLYECKMGTNKLSHEDGSKTLNSFLAYDTRIKTCLITRKVKGIYPTEKEFDDTKYAIEDVFVYGGAFDTIDAQNIVTATQAWSLSDVVYGKAFDQAKLNPEKYIRDFSDDETHREYFMLRAEDALKMSGVVRKLILDGSKFRNSVYDKLIKVAFLTTLLKTHTEEEIIKEIDK